MQSYSIPHLLHISADDFREFLIRHESHALDIYLLPERHNVDSVNQEAFRRIVALCVLALHDAEMIDAFTLDHIPTNRIFVITLKTAMARWCVEGVPTSYQFNAETIDLMTHAMNTAAEFILLSLDCKDTPHP